MLSKRPQDEIVVVLFGDISSDDDSCHGYSENKEVEQQ